MIDWTDNLSLSYQIFMKITFNKVTKYNYCFWPKNPYGKLKGLKRPRIVRHFDTAKTYLLILIKPQFHHFTRETYSAIWRSDVFPVATIALFQFYIPQNLYFCFKLWHSFRILRHWPIGQLWNLWSGALWPFDCDEHGKNPKKMIN